MSNYLFKAQSSAALTPCAGRCSTVFGDSVCRGCRRFNHEVIDWNRYTAEEKQAIWLRLDQQLDQILLPMLVNYHLPQIMQFLQHKRVRLMPNASLGRKLYHALKLCEKHSEFTEESGLGVSKKEMRQIWKAFEAKVLYLAQASYEVAWLRANFIHKNLNELDLEDDV